MIRSAVTCVCRKYRVIANVHRRNIFQDSLKCSEAWAARLDSDILKKVRVDELYIELDQKYNRSGNISAIDVDILANGLNDPTYLDELSDIIHKLRKTSETANTLRSTHYAIIRHYIDFDRTDSLLNILDDRLNYGIFLDEFSANMLMDHFFKRNDFKSAARTATFLMLQEDFINDLIADLCLVACLSYLPNPDPFYPKETVVKEVKQQPKGRGKKKDDGEIKVRVGFLRNPFFDDHFDLRDENDLVGKTIAMASKRSNAPDGLNGQIIGWLLYKKFDKMKNCAEKLMSSPNKLIFKETISTLEDKLNNENYKDGHEAIKAVLDSLNRCQVDDITLLEFIRERMIKAAKASENDLIQRKLKEFQSWEEERKTKLEEQLQRLDKQRRLENIENVQKSIASEEERLWFFENEEKIDLEIEKKKALYPKKWFGKKKTSVAAQDYIPPELPNARRTGKK